MRQRCRVWFFLPRDSTRRSTVGLCTGLHTGEFERTSDDVAGLAVQLTARITSLAATSEILVSRTVRDLVMHLDTAAAIRRGKLRRSSFPR